jgi:hypothetical protein
MDQVEVERAYRIIASLRKTANELADDSIPLLTEAMRRWRAATVRLDLLVLVLAAAGFFAWSIAAGDWDGLSYRPAWLTWLEAQGMERAPQIATALVVALAGLAHLGMRRIAAGGVGKWLKRQIQDKQPPGDPLGAFNANVRRWGGELSGRPAGLNKWAEERITKVLHECETYVQSLNERFTNPRGLKD